MPYCMFLDGNKAGEIIRRRDAPPYLDIPYLGTIQKIEIDPHLDSKPIGLSITRYKMTFRSIDGKFFLYSLTGNSDILTAVRDWIVKPKELRRPQPVYFENNK